MTDDLVKRLENVRCDGIEELCWEAADRIKALTAERDVLAAEVERLRGHLDDAASAVEWGARRMGTQSYKVLMEKWASEYRAAQEKNDD